MANDRPPSERIDALEKLIHLLDERWHRDGAALDQRILNLTNQCIALKRTQDDLLRMVSAARDTALEAKAQTEDGTHQFGAMAQGVEEHLKRLEESRQSADRQQSAAIEEIRAALELSEQTRRNASGAHAQRFNEQTAAVEEIRASLAAAEKGRVAASASHAQRFKEQNDAIRAIAKGVGSDRRIRYLSMLIIPALVVVLHQLVELTKFVIAVKYRVDPTHVEVPPP